MRKEEYLDFTGLSTFLGNLKNLFVSKEELNEKDFNVDIMQGATQSSPGKSGLVPLPSSGQNVCFLRGDGLWTDLSNYFNKIEVLENEIEILKQLISDVEDLNFDTIKTNDGISISTNNNEKLVLNENVQ